MQWSSLDIWIVIAAMLSAMSCALLGNFLVLRKMSMMGDAISHAVLPGLAVAFLITASRDSFTMFIGAAVVGVLTALLTQWISRFGKVDEGASMGVVFTALFAVGLILIVRAADSVDLDPGCVLYGAIELTPLDTVALPPSLTQSAAWAGLGLPVHVPRAVMTLAAMLLFNLLFVLFFFKELKISSFDPALATTLGINAGLMHYLLMTLVAATTVASFESVGSILVIAMLIAPPAAAHLLTERLGSMILVSLVIGVLCAVGGHYTAIVVPGWFGYEQDTSTSGMMAAVAGFIFLLVMLIAPRHGVVSKLVHRALLTLRIVREDILGILYRFEELKTGRAAMAAVEVKELISAPRPALWLAVLELRRRGRILREEQGYRLTDTGRDAARSLLRSHRLWENYLVKEVDVRVDHSHGSAERLEHITDPAMQKELAAKAAGTDTDPQGKPIP